MVKCVRLKYDSLLELCKSDPKSFVVRLYFVIFNKVCGGRVGIGLIGLIPETTTDLDGGAGASPPWYGPFRPRVHHFSNCLCSLPHIGDRLGAAYANMGDRLGTAYAIAYAHFLR